MWTKPCLWVSWIGAVPMWKLLNKNWRLGIEHHCFEKTSPLITKHCGVWQPTKLLLTIYSLQHKCHTADPDWQNLGRFGKLSFVIIYKFWQNCASVWQVSDPILKTGFISLNDPWDIKNNAWVAVNNDFLSRVGRFGNDFHEWRSHEWKSLPNRLTSDKKNRYSR